VCPFVFSGPLGCRGDSSRHFLFKPRSSPGAGTVRSDRLRTGPRVPTRLVGRGEGLPERALGRRGTLPPPSGPHPFVGRVGRRWSGLSHGGSPSFSGYRGGDPVGVGNGPPENSSPTTRHPGVPGHFGLGGGMLPREGDRHPRGSNPEEAPPTRRRGPGSCGGPRPRLPASLNEPPMVF